VTVAPRRLGLFEACGIELEYMIVDTATLDVAPLAGEVLHDLAGAYEEEVGLGPVACSNELALHVLELKTNGPAPSLQGLSPAFDGGIATINGLLRQRGAQLMPSAMHPWMDPHKELRLWPHHYNAVYAAFDRIFDCRGHGWANLQSVHLNLPFDGDEQFGRLHAAVRLALPLLPAIAASSPFMDGVASGLADSRMDVYRGNAARVPSVSGVIVPEPLFTQADYEGILLRGIYEDLAPLDPDGVLRYEWVNARGAIARFDRMALEVRAMDVQECPRADLAVCSALVAVVRALVSEKLCPYERQRSWSERTLAAILASTIKDGERAVIDDREYLRCLGLTDGGPVSAWELWGHLLDQTWSPGVDGVEFGSVLQRYRREGTLSTRIVRATGGQPDRASLRRVYGELAQCLAQGRSFPLL